MKPFKSRTISIQENEKIVDIDIDERLAAFYKKETGHRRVTNNGLSKFFTNLVKLFGR